MNTAGDNATAFPLAAVRLDAAPDGVRQSEMPQSAMSQSDTSQPGPHGQRWAIIGGGLTGLAAAHRVQELCSKSGSRPLITVFEASARWGGLVGTRAHDGYLVDTGADSFLTNKPSAVALCQRLGLEPALQSTDPRFRGALVLFDGRPVPVPEGYQLLTPTALWPVLTSPILSPWGKLRLAMERWVPPRPLHVHDESLASFVRRRFGEEALDRLVQPLVGGIYTSDPEQLSLAATMPRFLEQERTWGSLIRASQQTDLTESRGDRSSGARYGLFAGLQGGMQQLVDRLVERLADTVELRLSTAVTQIRPCSPEGTDHSDSSNGSAGGSSSTSHDASTSTVGHRSRAGYVLTWGNGQQQRFDRVIITLPAGPAARLVRSLDPQLADALASVQYASSAIVVSGHRLDDITHPLNAFGLVIPHRERRRILAVSFSSRKFPNRAPNGRVLLRTFVGGALQPELLTDDDDRLVQLVREELEAVLGVQGTPDFAWVVRYPQAMPQYHLGHLEKVDLIERLCRQHSDFALAGNAYRGVGVPDAIASGEAAVQRLWVPAT
jgi:protoporphyrinogen/coproporphyrinogen III oxidase